MYAALSSLTYWDDIEKAVASVGEDIGHKVIDKDIDILAEIDRLNLLSVKHLIIDLTAIGDIELLPQAIMKFRIKNSKAQIIVIAPNYTPGNEILSQIFSMKVWDILNPSEGQSVQDLIASVLVKPNEYMHAVKWYIPDANKTNSANSMQKSTPQTKYISFKKKIFTVFDCPEFAGEFAYSIANNTDLSVLIIDTDRLTPILENVLASLSQFNPDVKLDIKTKSSFNVALELASKNILNRQAFYNIANKTKSKNLKLLTGNDIIENCEYYTEQPYNTLIDQAYNDFDVVVLSTNGYIYDYYTILALVKSTVNIIPVYADLNSIRSMKGIMNYLVSKQNMDIEKNEYVVFEHNPNNLSIPKVEEVLEQDLSGIISYSVHRVEARNNVGICYAAGMDNQIRNQYLKLLQKYDIIPKPKFSDKIASFFSKDKPGKGGNEDCSSKL